MHPVQTLFFEKYNHISFLSRGTNDAMTEFLAPLIPIAKKLGIPMLDFDVYDENRDSVECASETVPVVVQFFRDNL